MMQRRRSRWLENRGLGRLTLAAMLVAAAWAGCDQGGQQNVVTDDDEGEGGTAPELPCGIDCTTIQTDACSEAVCNEDTLLCEVLPLSDMECDDGLFCTIGDMCVNGVCTGQAENKCNLDPPSWTCQGVLCDEDTKSCTQVPLAEGTECIASDPCVVGATCNANNLCTGPTNDCFFANTPDSCHRAVCNSGSGECEPVPANAGLPCLDGLCSEGGTCDSAGNCSGASAKDCTFVTDDCNTGMCDSATGGCTKMAANDGGACTDNVGCTVGDQCAAGDCASGTAVTACSDDDGCCPTGCDSGTDNDCQAILLVGDDLPLSGWQAYRDALIAAGREDWDEANYDFPSSNNGTFPDAAMLANYDTVILVAESHTDWPDEDNNAIVTWLQEVGERNLLLIGKDILYDFYLHAQNCAHDPCDTGPALTSGCASYISTVCNATSGNPDCCNVTWDAACVAAYETANPSTCPNGEHELLQLMGVAYEGSAAGTQIFEMLGVSGDPITDPFFSVPIRLSQDQNSSGDYALVGGGAATDIGFYNGPGGQGDGRVAMARYAPSYQLVWMGYNFHDGTVEFDQRNELMRAIMEWFKL